MNKKQSILLILLVFILQFRSYTFAQVQNIDFWTFIEKTNDCRNKNSISANIARLLSNRSHRYTMGYAQLSGIRKKWVH